jgi:8-oxo-dGTP diphosphatase
VTVAQSKFARVLAGVLGIVVDHGGRVAFVHQQRGPYAGNWLLPGGAIEIGEPADVAVRREVAEETGLEVTDFRPFALYELRGTWFEGPYHLLMLAFRGTTSDVIAEAWVGDNVADVRQAQVGDLPLHSTDLMILSDAGVASFSDSAITSALAADEIDMRAFTIE